MLNSRESGSSVTRLTQLAGVLAVLLVSNACKKSQTETTTTTSGQDCSNAAALTGTSWSPSPAGASEANRDSSVQITKTEYTATGSLVGAGQAAPASKEITISIDMSQDL